MKIFHLPDLGEGLAEAEIREWYVTVGDVVKVDQPLVSMETAKAVVDVPSPYAGKITLLHGNPNDMIKTGAALITFETDDVSEDKGSVVGKLETSEKKWNEAKVIGAVRSTTPSIKAMPAARVLAKELGIDLSQVTPTGPNDLITAEDVKKCFTHSPKNLSSIAGQMEGKTETLHGVRRTMALAMTQSHQDIVPVTIIEDANISHLPPKSDLTVLLIKAIASAATIEPALNAWFDGKTLARTLFTEVNVGLAADTPEGLFVPVIKNVATTSDDTLREVIDRFKDTVRTRTITAKDMQGATITLSNFGTIAGRYATPIIVPPAVAILGCGRSRETALSQDGQIRSGRLLPLSLTFDHRAVTGGEATRFLEAVIHHLQRV